MHHWVTKKSKALFYTPLLLLLALAVACGAAATVAPTATSAPAPVSPTEPAAAADPAGAADPTAAADPVPTAAVKPTAVSTGPVEAKVDRLRVAFTPPPKETNLPWSGPRSLLTQLGPMYETLLDLDPETGELVPMLANKWEMSSDGKSWTVDLRKDVPFHFGFGTFDAKDVAWMRDRMGAQEGNLNSFRNTWAKTVETVEVVDDYRVVFKLAKPDPNLNFFLSQSGDLALMSKAQFDQVGEDGMRDQFVATGPYRFLERVTGQSISYETVPYEHWRVPQPDFKEIEQFWAPESATRLAMLLTGEAQVAELPRDVLAQAEDRGMKTVQSGLGALHTWMIMGGQYYITGDEALDPTVPWAMPGDRGRLVRQALNKSINRDEINEFIFRGGGAPYLVHGYHPTLPGWNTEWEDRWEEMYGYDPEKARELLAEAGFPDGFKLKMWGSHTLPGVPELPDIAEAVGIFFTDIGLDVEIVSLEFSALRPHYRTKTAQGFIWGLRTVRRPLQEQIRLFNLPDGVVHHYETDSIVEKWEQLSLTLDPVERDRILREIGNEKFNEFETIPLLWIFFQLAVDPAIVAEYKFPGTGASNFSHLETIKAVAK